jgi:hypothetical protein
MEVGGSSRSFLTNPNLFDHIISAKNNCGQSIKIRVCYYRSEHCKPIEIPGYAHKEVILGTMPSMREFRYEFYEQL